jgi:copper chaperone CopZ
MLIQKTYSIPNMHCSACVMRLEGLEDDLPGIKSIKASYHKQKLEIEFDDALVSEEKILQAISEMDYQVR